MAFEKDCIGAENLGANAGEDLRLFQGLAVRLSNIGVSRALSTDAGSGGVYCLVGAADSGQAVKVWGPPNMAQAKAGAAITAGANVTINASAFFVVGSFANRVGVCHAAVSSGMLFPLRLL